MAYNAARLHFTSPSYDCFKYHFKSRATSASKPYITNKFLFIKLQKNYSARDVGNIVAANAAADLGSVPWINSCFNGDGMDAYQEWTGRQESSSYMFAKDLGILRNMMEQKGWTIHNLIDAPDPGILFLVYSKQIHIDTLIMLSRALGFLSKWPDDVDALWSTTFKHFVYKYRPFMTQLAPDKIKDIVKQELIDKSIDNLFKEKQHA